MSGLPFLHFRSITLPVEDSIEPSVYRFILRHSLKQQIMLLILTLVSFPFLYYSLDLPKTIVNHAIKDDAKFPQYVLGFEFTRRQVPRRPTDGLAILWCRAAGDWLSLGAEPERWRPCPDLGPSQEGRRLPSF